MKRNRISQLLLLGIVVTAIVYMVTRGGEPRKGDRFRFLNSGNFQLYDVFRTGQVMDLVRTPLSSRWVANLVFKPLGEYPYDELHRGNQSSERPHPVLLRVLNDTFDKSSSSHQLRMLLLREGLQSRDIESALEEARNYVEEPLRSTQQNPQITVSVLLVQHDTVNIRFTGVQSPHTAYELLSIARPVRRVGEGWEHYEGWGPYVPGRKVVSNANEIILRKRDGDEYAARWPAELSFQVAPRLSTPQELDPERDVLAIRSGYSSDAVPTAFKKFVIPFGYTYVAVVLSDTVHSEGVYSRLRSLARAFVQGHREERLERYWIPEGWLRLGRATDLHQWLNEVAPPFPRANLPQNEPRALPFRVGVFTGTGPWVAPINFQNFRSSFFRNVQGQIRSVRDAEETQVDVLIYKAFFNPFLDSPAVLYEFGARLIGGRYEEMLRAFSSYMLDAGPTANITVQQAVNIQATLRRGLRIFPLFSEPITVYVNTNKIGRLYMNYREGFTRMDQWKWKP